MSPFAPRKVIFKAGNLSRSETLSINLLLHGNLSLDRLFLSG